ncbi:MAG: hypothetical protein NC127_04345 [Muribaculum sp.]|nr:hypothetical protein [Muribaculum sp.]
MKKLILAIVAIAMLSVNCMAGQPQGGIFKHVGVGVGAGTNGISVELSTPITRWFQLRAGVSMLPNFKLKTDADVSFSGSQNIGGNNYDYSQEETIDLEGAFGRTQGSIILNIYPLPWGSFYIAGGLYFGGNKLLKVTGHSDYIADNYQNFKDAGVEIGDYTIPVDQNGNVRGGLKVKNVRPYLGIGWGRAVPNNRLNFGIELGVQFMGSPKLYTDFGDVNEIINQAGGDNDIQKVMDKLTVWPVLTFKLSGRIF